MWCTPGAVIIGRAPARRSYETRRPVDQGCLPVGLAPAVEGGKRIATIKWSG
jgi:hypothetical protein